MAQAQAYDQTGAPIPDDQVAQAATDGRAAFTAGATVFMRDPTTDKDVAMPAEQAAHAAANGFQVLDPSYVAAKQQEASDRREYGGVGGQVKAGAAGAARGASFGLSDAVLAEAGYSEDLRKLKEQNPLTSTVSEIGGAVAPMLLSGGSGALAKGASTLGAAPLAVARAGTAVERGTLALLRGGGESALGRIGAKALATGAGGALEGAAYGAGQALSEASLNDQDLTAEKLLSATGEGAMFGGLAAGGLGALGAAGKMGAQRLLGKSGSAQQALGSFAERQALKQVTGGDAKAYANLIKYGGEARVQRVGRELLDEGIPMTGKGWSERAAEAVTQKLDDAGRKMESVAQQLDDAGHAIDGAALASKVDEQLAALRASTSGTKARLADRIESEFAPLRDRLRATSVEPGTVAGSPHTLDLIPAGAEATTVAARPLSFSEMWKARRELDEVINFDKLGQDPATNALKDLRKAYNDVLEAPISGASDDLAKQWEASKSKYSDYRQVSDAIKRSGQKNLRSSLLSTGDSLTGGLGVATGLLASGGSSLMGLATGGATSLANKFLRDQGGGYIARFADRLSKVDVRMDQAAQQLAGVTKRSVARDAAPAVVAGLADRYARTRDQVNELQDPVKLQNHLMAATQGLEREHPELVGAMQQRVAADADYLRSRLPQPLNSTGNTLTPMATEPKVSRVDMAKFLSAADALADPVSVIESIATGKIDYDAVEAIKVRRPKIFETMRTKVITYTATRQEELPYAQKVSLSLAFDFTGDPSLAPETMTTIQATYIPAPTENASAGPGSAKVGRPAKLDGETAVKAFALPGDAANARA